jgi:hypothetical protein
MYKVDKRALRAEWDAREAGASERQGPPGA